MECTNRDAVDVVVSCKADGILDTSAVSRYGLLSTTTPAAQKEELL